jgi:hypothetical protein
MKQKIYLLGILTTLMIVTGTVFKVNHLAGAGVLLTLGIVTFELLFIPLALLNNYRSGDNKQNLPLYIVTWLTCFVVFTGMLFKAQHWPSAGLWLTIALPFPYIVFLPVFLYFTSKTKNFNIYNTVFVLLLLTLNSVFSGLLAVNVSKNRIDESYNLSHNYTRLDPVLKEFPTSKVPSVVKSDIDGVLEIVSSYQDKILKQAGFTKEQWYSNPRDLSRADRKDVVASALLNSAVQYPGEELYTGLRNLILDLGKNPEYKNLAEKAPVIFNFYENEKDRNWAREAFTSNTLSWSLMYLDGLETNLNIIKSTI